MPIENLNLGEFDFKLSTYYNLHSDFDLRQKHHNGIIGETDRRLVHIFWKAYHLGHTVKI